MDEDDYLHDEGLADLLGISVKALRNKVALGEPLPPRIQPPGMRARLWPRRAVNEWLSQFLMNPTLESLAPSEVNHPGSPGRPRKANWKKRLP